MDMESVYRFWLKSNAFFALLTGGASVIISLVLLSSIQKIDWESFDLISIIYAVPFQILLIVQHIAALIVILIKREWCVLKGALKNWLILNCLISLFGVVTVYLAFLIIPTSMNIVSAIAANDWNELLTLTIVSLGFIQHFIAIATIIIIGTSNLDDFE